MSINKCLVAIYMLFVLCEKCDCADVLNEKQQINQISQGIMDLYSQDAQVREKAATMLVAKGNVVIPYFRNSIRNTILPEDIMFVKVAVNILERIKTKEAIDELVLKIGVIMNPFTRKVVRKNDQCIMEAYPAYAGIVRIGKPAIPMLKTELLQQETSLKRYLYVRALSQIGGVEAKQAVEEYIAILERRLSDAKNALHNIETNAPCSVGVQGNMDRENGEKISEE